MQILYWIIPFTLLGGVLSVLAASLFLLLPERQRKIALPHGVSFATGALLGVSFLALLPHAFEEVGLENLHSVSATILVGILSFFMLEKLVLWRHCHSGHCEAHVDVEEHRHKSAGTLILIGDGLHNFVDGILIAAAFMADIHLGVVTSLAVAAHEIPQEVGDFAILLESGFSRAKALLFNVLSSMTTVIGGVLAWYGFDDLHQYLPYVLAVAASSFIYIAVADLIPTLHKKTDSLDSLKQFILIAAGVFLITFLHGLMH
ncbi:MAG: ZIP family metal transporter [Gammaproteobacteria bacterium]|nr:MAG: ZIP family metal transporter [Gammaproteobacteria bacterium]